jgi:catecholate siderophore receptor
MTRKALRKRRRLLAKQQSSRRPVARSATPWMAVGALVASATLTSPASAAEIEWRGTFAAGGRDSVVATVLRVSEFSGRRLSAAGLDGIGATEEPLTRKYDISAGPLSDVLPRFEAVAGIRVSLSIESIGTIQSPGVKGLYTVERALEELLVGTSLGFRMDAPNHATVDLRTQSESVQVTASAPTAMVSSPKYVVPMREIPQTIEVIPRAVIEQQAVTTLSDALRNVPGITLQAGEGGAAANTAGDMFNLRGFNASNSLFVDGVRDDGLISRDVYNLEQVEVFMGPTGTDVGRGTAAGYVNLQSKVPTLSSGTSALLSYGSADQKRLTVDFDQVLPLGQPGSWLSRSAVRLNGLWQEGGVPGRDIVSQERQAIAPSFALGIGTPTRVTLAAQIMRQDNVPDYGIPGAAWGEEPLAPTTAIAKRPVDSTNYYGSVGFDYDQASQDAYTARIERDVNARLTLRNQTRYQRAEREAVITSIQNPAAFDAVTERVTLARQGNDRRNSMVSNQTTGISRFSTGRLDHASTFGLDINSEDQNAPVLGGLGTRAAADIYSPNPFDPVTGYAPIRTGASATGHTNTIGFYAFDTVDLGRKWQVNGGIRAEHYETTFRSVDAGGLVTADLGSSDVIMSGKAGVLYKASATGNVYASVGTSVTPPGTANFTLSAQANNQNNPNVEPQESANYEVGAKWDVAGGRLSLNAAVFRTENRNVIFTVDATAIPPVYNQDDSQRVNGMSLGTIGRINRNWDVLANFAWLDSSLETQSDANRGNRLTLTPKYSASIWTSYRLPRNLTVGGGIRATDDVFINAANTIKSPGYFLADGLIEYAVNQNLSLRLNLTNLTDNVYIRNVNNNGGRFNPGQPRAAILTSSITF